MVSIYFRLGRFSSPTTQTHTNTRTARENLAHAQRANIIIDGSYAGAAPTEAQCGGKKRRGA